MIIQKNKNSFLALLWVRRCKVMYIYLSTVRSRRRTLGIADEPGLNSMFLGVLGWYFFF